MLPSGPTPSRRHTRSPSVRCSARSRRSSMPFVPTSGNPEQSLLTQEVGAHRVVLLVRGRQVERTALSEWPNTFWIAVLAILENGGHRLARCLRPECCRVFVRMRRQQYCSPRCSQSCARGAGMRRTDRKRSAVAGRPIRRRSRRSIRARRSPHARGARDGGEQGRGGRRADVARTAVRRGCSSAATRRQGIEASSPRSENECSMPSLSNRPFGHCQLVQVFLVDARRPTKPFANGVVGLAPARAGCHGRVHQGQRSGYIRVTAEASTPSRVNSTGTSSSSVNSMSCQFVEAEVECSLHALAVR